MLLLLPLASLALLAFMLKGFKYDQFVDRFAATKGETVFYRLMVRNKGILLLPYIEVAFYGSGTIYREDFVMRRMAIPPHGDHTLEIAFTCKFRGAYDIGVRQIRIKDYLGLFTFRQEIRKLGTLIIYPRIVFIDSFPMINDYDGNTLDFDARRHDNAETISEIRKYRSGDRLRTIHWKLSAKKDELMVKSFEQTSGAAIELILDARCEGRSGDDALELVDKIVECAVALAYHFASRAIPTTLHYFSDVLERQKQTSIHDFQLTYQLLSEASFDGGSLPSFSILALADGVRKKTIIIVTVGLSQQLCGEAYKLKASGCMVTLIAVQGGKDDAPEGLDEIKASLLRSGIVLCILGDCDDIGTALMRSMAV